MNLCIKLTIEVSKLVNQVKVLEQQRTHGSSSLPALRIVHGRTIGGSINGLIVVPIGSSGIIVGAHCC